MKYVPLSLILALFTLYSCAELDPNKQIDEGHVANGTYESKELGWTIVIPEGWKIIAKDKIEAREEKGKAILEESAGVEIDISGLKRLISFQRDQFNIFGSTSEPQVEEFPGEYDQNRKAINDLIYNAFLSQGIRTDTSSGIEVIQGLEFHAFYTTIFSPEGEKLFNQIMYSRMINGYDFGMTLTYNNEEDKQTMMDAIKQSKFTSQQLPERTIPNA